MNFADWSHAFLSTVSGHPVLERLFFASVEFAALVVLVWFFIRIARIKSARLMSLLWLVVLAKPIVSLALGSPLPVLRVPVLKEPVQNAEVAKPAEMTVEDQFVATGPGARRSTNRRCPRFQGRGRMGRGFSDNEFSFARNPE